LDAHRGDTVVPGVPATETPLAEVGNIAAGSATASTEVAIVVDGDARSPKDPDGGDIVTHATKFFADFAATQAEEAAAEVAIAIEASASAAPIAAMPFTARRPIAAGFGIPPTATAGTVPRATRATAGTAKAAYDKDGAATAFYPKPLAIDAPGLSLNARGAADLLLHSDFIGPVTAAIFAVIVVGFALESLLRKADRGKHKHNERQADVTKHGANSHELSPVEMSPRPRRQALPEAWIGAAGKSLPHSGRGRVKVARKVNSAEGGGNGVREDQINTSLRTGCTAIHPELKLRRRVSAVERWERTAVAWIPAPADQVVKSYVLVNLLKGAAAILLGIFQLLAKLGWRAANEDHFVFWRR